MADTAAQALHHIPEAAAPAVAEAVCNLHWPQLPVQTHTPADSPPQRQRAPAATAPATAPEGPVVLQEEGVAGVREPCSTRSLFRRGSFLVPSPVTRHPVSVSRRSFRTPSRDAKSTPHVPASHANCNDKTALKRE